jgi:hypothetical protein
MVSQFRYKLGSYDWLADIAECFLGDTVVDNGGLVGDYFSPPSNSGKRGFAVEFRHNGAGVRCWFFSDRVCIAADWSLNDRDVIRLSYLTDGVGREAFWGAVESICAR